MYAMSKIMFETYLRTHLRMNTNALPLYFIHFSFACFQNSVAKLIAQPSLLMHARMATQVSPTFAFCFIAI